MLASYLKSFITFIAQIAITLPFVDVYIRDWKFKWNWKYLSEKWTIIPSISIAYVKPGLAALVKLV